MVFGIYCHILFAHVTTISSRFLSSFSEVDQDIHSLFFHFSDNLLDRKFGADAFGKNKYPSNRELKAIGINILHGAAQCSEDASPVRIAAMAGAFSQIW